MSRSWAKGSSRTWRLIRRLVIARDVAAGYKCRAHEDGWCERANTRKHDCRGRPETVHHTRGRRVTGDDPQYCVTACRTCNGAIGDPTTLRRGGIKIQPRTKW